MTTTDSGDIANAARCLINFSEISGYQCLCAVRVVTCGVDVTISSSANAQHSTQFEMSLKVPAASPCDRVHALMEHLQNPGFYRSRSKLADVIPPQTNACLAVSVRVNDVHCHTLEIAVRSADAFASILAECAAALQDLCAALPFALPCRRCRRKVLCPAIACDAAMGLAGNAGANGFCDACRVLAARRIARWASRCLADPSKAACRRRLLREFDQLAHETIYY